MGLPEGVWVIDVKRTGDLLKSTHLPTKNAEWLPGALLRMCVTTMTFSGGTLTRSNIGPAPTTESFRLVSLEKDALTYALVTSDGKGADTVTISYRDSEHFTMKSTQMMFMEYGVWQRGQQSTQQTGEMDFSRALEACTEMLKESDFRKDRKP